MGNKDNYIGPWSPKEDLLWQGNVQSSKKKFNIDKAKKLILGRKNPKISKNI